MLKSLLSNHKARTLVVVRYFENLDIVAQNFPDVSKINDFGPAIANQRY